MNTLFTRYKKEIAASSLALLLSVVMQAGLNWCISINSYQNGASYYNMNTFSTALSFVGILFTIYLILNKTIFNTLITRKKTLLGFMLLAGILLAYSPIYSEFGNTWNAANGSFVSAKDSIIDSLPNNKKRGYQQCTKKYNELLKYKTDVETKIQQQTNIENMIALDILKCFYSESNFFKNFNFYKTSHDNIPANKINVDISDIIYFKWNAGYINNIKHKIGDKFFNEIVEIIPKEHQEITSKYPLQLYSPPNDFAINVYDIYNAIDILGQRSMDNPKSLYALTKNNPKLHKDLADNFITYDRYKSMLQYEKEQLAELQNKVAYYKSLNTIELIKTEASLTLWIISLLFTFLMGAFATSTILYLVSINAVKYFKWCIKAINDNN